MRTTTRLAAVRAAAAAGALAVGLAGLGLGGVASAENPEPPSYGNIDTTKQASLTVHKHIKSKDGVAARPTGKDTLTQDKVQGVSFKAFKINVDLSTPEGWKTLSAQVDANKALSPDVCDPTKVGSYLKLTGLTVDVTGVELGTTDNTGSVTKTVNQGAYLVCETSTAGAKVVAANGATKDVKVTEKALPFIATVPFYDAQGNSATHGWIYDVHTYPKNTVVEAPSKAVAVDETKLGMGTAGQVTYTIDAKIPDIDDNAENFKYFTIWDQLAKGTAGISVEKVEVVGEDTDLTGKCTSAVVEDTRYVHVDCNTKDGLIFLRSNPEKTIRVTIKANISALPEAGDGMISNTGNLMVDTVSIPHDPSDPPAAPSDPTPPVDPPVTPPTGDNPPTPIDPENNTPTNKVVSAWGNLVVRKYDANDTAAKDGDKAGLDGAEFEVRRAASKVDGSFPATCDGQAADMTDEGKVTVGGKTTFTSTTVGGKKGILTIPGLFIDSKATAGKDENAPEHTSRCYFLVETKAPAGYVLDSTPKPFVVNAGTTADVEFGTNLIGNTKTAVPALPLTGASGQVLMMAGGAALVLLSAGTVLVARRREAQD